MKGASTMSSAIAFADNYTNWVLSTFRPFFGKKFLEIGTGQGNYKGFINEYDEYVSIDIDEELIARAKENDPEGVYHVCDVASSITIDLLGRNRFDTILCTNVLEHVQKDKDVFQNVSRLLATEGKFLLFVPAFPFLYSDMDRLAGHHRRYLKADLLKLASEHDLEVELIEYFNPIGAIGWWVNKFKKYDNLDDKNINGQILFFDKYILPASRFLNPITKKWWGQSLVAVFKKKINA